MTDQACDIVEHKGRIMNPTLIAAAVSILVVLITAIVSYVGLIISKENKISEFRQAWIDELRKDICDYIAYSLQHAFHYSNLRGSNKETARELINKHFSEESHVVDSLYTRIILRLNNTAEYDDIRKILSESYKCYADLLNRDNLSSDLSKLTDTLRDKASALLKDEWEVVKIGEPIFNQTKKHAPKVIGFVFLLLIILIGLSFVFPQEPSITPKILKCNCEQMVNKNYSSCKYQIKRVPNKAQQR